MCYKRPWALAEILIALTLTGIALPYLFNSLYTHLKYATIQNEKLLTLLAEDHALLLATQQIMKGDYSLDSLEEGVTKRYPITFQGIHLEPELEIYLDECDEQTPPKALLITVEVVPYQLDEHQEEERKPRRSEFYPKFISLCCVPKKPK